MVALVSLLDTALTIALWGTLCIYLFSVLWWLGETTLLSWGWRPGEDYAWDLNAVQARILTIDSAGVVQQTVDALPAELTDVHVIAEAPIDIDGATVHVVPDEFDCKATNKGRAVEWAHRNVSCDKEYVLYLDEDTIVTDLTGIPDADFVQFTEKPIYTGSRLTYLCEIFRTGYQLEQLAFHRLSYPLYAWGGGFAVRHELEEQLGWDVATITEDTNFIWRAARDYDIDYQLVNSRFRNQAPPSVRALLKQRRRWMSGTVADDDLLPVWYRPLYFTRVIAWAFSPFVLVITVSVYLLPISFPSLPLYELLSLGALSILFLYMLGGAIAYRKHPLLWPVLFLLTPVAIAIHATGALWGIVRPIEEFEVTEKVAPTVVERKNKGLDEGELSEHEGTERLVRDTESEYDPHPFED